MLGVKVDPASSDIASGNFEVATGRVRLAGQLTLNYERVNCIADINLETLDGEGYLEPVPAPVAEA